MAHENTVYFLALHSHFIVERLEQIRSISIQDVLDIYYTSDFNSLYKCENTKIWHFSDVIPTHLLDHEVRT